MISEATTQGIRVRVRPQYVQAHSDPQRGRYVFAYTVEIRNEGEDSAQLRTRHWIVVDGTGHIEEVKGPGVVGETPRLAPGESFQYTSGCVLTTPKGTMHGTYQMYRDSGESFDAEIAAFPLIAPGAGEVVLN